MSDDSEHTTVKPHVSYSAFKDWLDCGKAYQLKRILQLPERQAWWNVGGHAVHAATEEYDREQFTILGF